jgi:HicA toxin of bacterial toxin-antitoxin,
MNSRDIIRALERDGWRRVSVTGDHLHFRHPSKPALDRAQRAERHIAQWVRHGRDRQSGLRLRPRP